MSAIKDIARIGATKKPVQTSLRYSWYSLLENTPSKRRASTVGSDGLTIDDFHKDLDTRLNLLSKKISSQKFKYRPLKAYLIPKGDGNDRVICVPTVEDRLVQKTILSFLKENKSPYAIFNGMSYGLEGEHGVHAAVNAGKKFRQKYPYVYKTDVSKYFDQIKRHLLKDQIEKKIRHSSLHKLLINASLCEIERVDHGKFRRIQKAGIERGKGVRQGMPLSPFFANLFLYDFDQEILKIAIKLDFKVIRYVDDLVFFAKDEATCIEIDKLCREILNQIGLTIPELSTSGKTQIYKPDKEASFLGVGLCLDQHGKYKTVIPEKQRNKIAAKIHTLGDLNELAKDGTTLTKLMARFRGMRIGYEHTYSSCCEPSEVDSLLNSVDQWIEQARRQIFTNLGIDLTTLSDKQRAFLEIETS